jgi:hypothetical protein
MSRVAVFASSVLTLVFASAASRGGHAASGSDATAAVQVIVGRAASGSDVLLLTEEPALLVVTPSNGAIRRTPVTGVRGKVWGLAGRSDGSLWTLVDDRRLVRLAEGRAAEEIALSQPHLGLFGWGDTLIYQVHTRDAGAPVLRHGPAGNQNRRPFGSLTVRAPADKNLPGAWLANLARCGMGGGDQLPCWSVGENFIDRVSRAGLGSPVTLGNLQPTAVITPAGTNANRPIVDAYLGASGELWVLSTAGGPPAPPNTPQHAWSLFHYARDGSLLSEAKLDAPARLILDVQGRDCYVLFRPEVVKRVRVS